MTKKHSQLFFLHINVTLPFIIDNPLLRIMDCHLPYLGTHSAHLKNKLEKFMGKIYPKLRISFVFNPLNALKLFPFKDHVPSHLHSSVDYEFTCSSCKATYYGKTSRHYIVRCREHMGINKKGKTIKGVPSSTRDHVNSTGHSASVEDFCNLHNISNELDLLIHESLLILRDHPTLNQQNSSIP